MRAFVTKPSVALLAVMIVMLAWYVGQKKLEPELTPDTPSYFVDIFPLDVSLRGCRTLGYAVLANIVRPLSPQLHALPLVHLLSLFCAVMGFFFGLRKFGTSPWLAAAIAGSLLYFPPLLIHVNALLPEVAAATGAVFTVGMLFWIVACPRSLPAALSLGIGLFATYQMRPAYLFLVVLVPMLGVTLRYLLAKRCGEPSMLCGLGLRLVALTAVPYLGFCLFRWLIVGHFGLVSFGGVSLIGVAGQFLNEETAKSVPAHLQPLARGVLEIRQGERNWPTDHAGERLDFAQAEPLYDNVIYEQFIPALCRLPATEGPQGEANQVLNEMAWSLIKARPNLYLSWVVDAYATGLRRLPTLLWYRRLEQWTLRLLAVVALLALLRLAQRYGLRRSIVGEHRTPDYLFTCGCMLLVAVSFALSKLFMVCLVEAPYPRYLNSVYLFVPAAAGMIGYAALILVWNHATATVAEPLKPAGESASLRGFNSAGSKTRLRAS
jgi:hypothetical protein